MRKVIRARLVRLALCVCSLGLYSSARAERPPATPLRVQASVAEIQRLETEIDRARLALKGVGKFVYKSRWYWDEGIKVKPCLPSSGQYQTARLLLSRFDALLLKSTSPKELKSLRIQLKKVASQLCFATSAPLPYFTSLTSLQHYWSKGGRLALQAALNVKQTHTHVIAMSARRDILDLKAAQPRAAPLICQTQDSCSRETRWKEEEVRGLHLASLKSTLQELKSNDTGRRASRNRCNLYASTGPIDLQFELWRGCIARTFRNETLLPEGNIRAPRAGWLHLLLKSTTENLSSYIAINLATGAALRLPRGLVCTPPFQEWRNKAVSCRDDYKAPTSLRLNSDDAQHLAWLLLIGSQTNQGRPRTTTLPIPPHIEATGVIVPAMGSCSGSGMTHTTLSWVLVDDTGSLIATGTKRSSYQRRQMLDRTIDRYKNLIRTSTPLVRRQNAHSQSWPRAPRLPQEAWQHLSDPDLFQALDHFDTQQTPRSGTP